MAPIYGPRIPRENLSLCLDPGNVKSYPGSGTTWFDLSGNNNHAAMTGSPTIANGIISFDGTDDFATITTDGTGSLDFRQEQTVIMWLKHSFTSGRRNPWDQAYGGYGTWTHESGSYINYYYGSTGGNSSPYTNRGSGNTSRNIWNMMTVTRGSSVKWYTNESLINSAGLVYTPSVTTANIRIGRGYAGYWIGDMGLVMAYNRELSSDEVSAVYNAYKGRFL